MSYMPLRNDQSAGGADMSAGSQAYYPHNPGNPASAQAPVYQPQPQLQPDVANPQYAAPGPYAVPPQGYVPPQPQGAGYQQVYQQPPMNVPQGYVAVPVNPAMVQFQGAGQGLVAYNGLPMPMPGQWLDGIFDCFNDGVSCLLACCLPCIRQAITLDRARLMDFWVAICFFALWYITYVVVNSVSFSLYGTDNQVLWPGMVTMSVSLFYVVVRTHFRGKLREKYQIAGSQVEDFFLHCCCSCCSISQEARTVDRIEMNAIRV